MRAKRFRKKPVEIEAMQGRAYTEFAQIVTWINENGGDARATQIDPGPAYMEITTLEGVMRADVGDWVIKGIQGEFYPCKPEIFDATYEPVTQGGARS